MQVEAPFALLWARYPMPAPFNHGCFGVKLRQVLCGDIGTAFISNFQIDFPWFATACPEVASVDKLIVAHGLSQPDMQQVVHQTTKGWAAKVPFCQVSMRLSKPVTLWPHARADLMHYLAAQQWCLQCLKALTHRPAPGDSDWTVH
jgi:hypothetical protein